MSEIAEYLDDRNMGNLETMSLDEYKYHLEHEHFLFVEGHGFLVDDFTGRRFAASQEQLDLLIAYLQKQREEMSEHDKRYV
ncbi:hypothetical protein ACLIXB_002188 [Yersinia enterocolitica]|uniref:Uncharacterized protein n=2 Tax=Yersinia TaxID=629 RepID=A0A8D4SRR4_9GAMM|nr:MULTISPECIES: hypothetical protein [Yersinia]AKF36521.1 hypothetical protein FORC2_0374 [Yersinia enterocolitica]ALG46877.1 hypothetical protein LI89_19780 [Yersinia enterocolitica]AYD45465.1 hypothetical protein DXZ79_18260 [Yersinia rochesterensis]OVZ88117.1 hypothetical protein CBW57_06350 [Yersinia intermedia]RXA97002.1 hypothetical protein EQP49_06395 [Yersinia sp. 2105 StPb PI]